MREGRAREVLLSQPMQSLSLIALRVSHGGVDSVGKDKVIDLDLLECSNVLLILILAKEVDVEF